MRTRCTRQILKFKAGQNVPTISKVDSLVEIRLIWPCHLYSGFLFDVRAIIETKESDFHEETITQHQMSGRTCFRKGAKFELRPKY
jgi:hypothetical protein